MEQANGFSLIIPTFQEANNIIPLLDRIAQVDFANQAFEVLLIDDNSNDGTLEIVTELQKRYAWLKIIVRQGQRDLSQSVFDGFNIAKYPVLVTMDADLSHPPEMVPHLLAALHGPEVDMALGSRYVTGGSMGKNWPLLRQLTSRFAAGLARLLLPIKVKDPLSGFFAIRKQTLVLGEPFDMVGWKYVLEIIIKCRCQSIKEIPIHFAERKHGQSKLNLKIMLNYFQQLMRLVKDSR